jgi:hypothetical protein
LEQPNIEWDERAASFIFRARVDRSVEKSPIYLDWGMAGIGGQPIINQSMWGFPRIEIGFVERYAVGQMLRVTIGSMTTNEAGQQVFQWGEPQYNNQKVSLGSTTSYVARVVIIGKDGKEERYPFFMIPRIPAPTSNAISPAIVVGAGAWHSGEATGTRLDGVVDAENLVTLAA